jgi:mannose-1-phosphate guanylyltransferase
VAGDTMGARRAQEESGIVEGREEQEGAETSPKVAVVIMAGGVGTRFWPLSTRRRPKQFLSLLGTTSLLQQSFERARMLAPPERILVLTNGDFLSLVEEQLPELPPGNSVGEPMRRDTAAAVTLGALLCSRRFGSCVMVVLTADHRIEPADEFRMTMESAIRAAAGSKALYTIGIAPTYPSCAYGYLQRGRLVAEDDDVRHYRLDYFREKPDVETAQAYLRSGGFCWNSGMFVWDVDSILTEVEAQLPRHVELLAPVAEADGLPDWDEELRAAFAALPSISIDYGVMEKAEDVRMVEATFEWSDLGGWLALDEFLEADAQDNRHQGRVVALSAWGNMVVNEDPEELVALLGVRNLVVVRAGRRTLVAERSRAEEIRELVNLLEETGHGRDL